VASPEDDALTLIEKLLQTKRFFMIAVGTGESKFLAKAASLWATRKYIKGERLFPGKKDWGYVQAGKRHVLVSVQRGKEKSFLARLPLTYLWDIPPDDMSILVSLGLRTFGDIQKISLDDLISKLGDRAYLVKNWAEGKDGSSVKPMFIPPSITKELNIEVPLSGFSLSVLENTLNEMWALLEKKGAGFKAMKISLSLSLPGGSSKVEAGKSLLYTVCEFETVKNIAGLLLEAIEGKVHIEEEPFVGGEPFITSVTITLSQITKISMKNPVLVWDPGDKTGKVQALSLPLKAALSGIREKYGESALGFCFESCDMRREKMLSLWDPVRARVSGNFDLRDPGQMRSG